MAATNDEQALDDVPPNLDEVLRPHRSRRRRIWQGALVALVTVVALGVIIVRPDVAAWLPQTVGGQMVVVRSNVTSAKIAVSGPDVRMVSHLPFSYMLPKRLYPYTVSITFDAPPFAQQACRLSVPHQAKDTCRVAPHQITHGYAELVVVQFPEGMGDLAQGPAQAAVDAVGHYVQGQVQQTLIAVGGHYALGTPFTSQVFTAAVPLVASLLTAPVPGQDSGCFAVCPGDLIASPLAEAQQGPAPEQMWGIRLSVRRQWQFADATNGRILGMNPESQGPALRDLVAAWTGATWVISRRPVVGANGGPPQHDTFGRPLTGICDDARVVFTNLFFQASLGYLDPQLTLGDHGVEGCVIRTHLTPDGQTTGTPVGFLWRFGQMFAVNAQTLALVTNFPMANGVDVAPFTSDLGA